MNLLLLAGTSEARDIATQLATMPGVTATASLAGTTRTPARQGIATRVGGFGGDTGFQRYLHEQQIHAVLDATHPYAVRITDRTARICAELALPHLLLLRPPWLPVAGDCWVDVDAEEDAAAVIPGGARVFVATGPQTVERYANMGGRELIVRRIDPADSPFPLPGGRFLDGRGPFTEAGETALFGQLGINWLVTRNAGGAASRPKLTAARNLGLPVAMIRRPDPPDCARVADVAAALNWVRALT